MPRRKSKTKPLLSPYMKRKLQCQTDLTLAFGPWRQRQVDKETLYYLNLEHRQKLKRKGLVRDYETDRPLGRPRFWQLPPEVRPLAEEYENQLCQKWASRIRHTPRFARVLHMIAINQFRNPGQSREAWMKGRGYLLRAKNIISRLMEGM